MKDILEKMESVIKSLEKENGSFLLFALFLREEPLEKWDIIVSASWLSSSKMKSYKTVSSKLRDYFSDSEFVQFARVVILNQEDPVVSDLLGFETFKKGGFEELSSDELTEKFKFTIKRAYLLRKTQSNKLRSSPIHKRTTKRQEHRL